jgi:hypothetical protein
MKDPFAEALTAILNRSGKDYYETHIYHGKTVCFIDRHPHRGSESEEVYDELQAE